MGNAGGLIGVCCFAQFFLYKSNTVTMQGLTFCVFTELARCSSWTIGKSDAVYEWKVQPN